MSKLEQSSLYQLTMVRFRLFLREPEAIFWIFVFPILLAVGLGIAFRNRPADVFQVGATTAQLTQALAADKGLRAATMSEADGTRALATGSILLLVTKTPDGVSYEYDETNPDARTARMVADRAIQTAAGRREAVHVENQLVHETGSRYIDFVVPGLLGMNLMGSAIWGMGFSIVESQAEEAAQAPGGFAHAALAVPGLVPAVAAVDAGDRGGGLSGLCAAGLWRTVSWVDVAVGIALRAYFARVLRAGAPGSLAGKDDGGGLRTDEPGHAPHVDLVRSLFFGDTFSSGDPTRGASPSADGSHRGAAGKYAAGYEPGPADGSDRYTARLAGSGLCCLAAHLSLEIGGS